MAKFRLSRSASLKSHTTPCRLGVKFIRIIVSSSAVKLKEVLLPFAVICESSWQLLMVWRDWNLGDYGALLEWYWQGLNRRTQNKTFPHTTLSTNPMWIFLGSRAGFRREWWWQPATWHRFISLQRCKRRLLPQRRFKSNQSVTAPQKSVVSYELGSHRKFSVQCSPSTSKPPTPYTRVLLEKLKKFHS